MRSAASSIASTPSPPSSPRMSRWRLAVLVMALAGFFMMHGSSPGDSCVATTSSAAGASTSMTAAPATQTASDISTSSVESSTHSTSAKAAMDEQGGGTMGVACTPLRPVSAGAFVPLLTVFAAMPAGWGGALALLAGVAQGARRRAVAVRVLVCVSRT